jgi:hypothetical protein
VKIHFIELISCIFMYSEYKVMILVVLPSSRIVKTDRCFIPDSKVSAGCDCHISGILHSYTIQGMDINLFVFCHVFAY